MYFSMYITLNSLFLLVVTFQVNQEQRSGHKKNVHKILNNETENKIAD